MQELRRRRCILCAFRRSLTTHKAVPRSVLWLSAFRSSFTTFLPSLYSSFVPSRRLLLVRRPRGPHTHRVGRLLPSFFLTSFLLSFFVPSFLPLFLPSQPSFLPSYLGRLEVFVPSFLPSLQTVLPSILLSFLPSIHPSHTGKFQIS